MPFLRREGALTLSGQFCLVSRENRHLPHVIGAQAWAAAAAVGHDDHLLNRKTQTFVWESDGGGLFHQHTTWPTPPIFTHFEWHKNYIDRPQTRSILLEDKPKASIFTVYTLGATYVKNKLLYGGKTSTLKKKKMVPMQSFPYSITRFSFFECAYSLPLLLFQS